MRVRSFVAALVVSSSLLGCGPNCESGTLVAALTYDDTSRTADTIVVRSTINGQSMTATQPYTGQTQVRVPFPDVAYSAGLVVDVYVEAKKGNAVVATAARTNYLLPKSCAVLPLTFDETGTHFTLSGNVDGLLGTGLVLSDGTESLMASAGAFAFPTTLASGQPYNVSVTTQPSSPTQMCVVTNGDGTIDDADVTDVAITCTTNQYLLGGAVTNLTGDDLEIEVNGTQVVTLSEPGTSYSFPTKLDSGTAYTVKVVKQPTTQTCLFTSSSSDSVSGTVVDMDLTHLDINCT